MKSYLKLSVSTELRTQLVTAIKKMGTDERQQRVRPVVRKDHAVKPIRVGIWYKGYDAEGNRELLREELRATARGIAFILCSPFL